MIVASPSTCAARFFLTRRIARRMLEQAPLEAGPPRSIVSITSVNAEVASITRGEYCISKAGASMLTKLFALRLAPHGIGVFEVRPGIIRTAMTAPVAERYEREIARGITPIARWGEPADIGRAVATIATRQLPFSAGHLRQRRSQPAGVLTDWNDGRSCAPSASSRYTVSPWSVGIQIMPGPLAQPRPWIRPRLASSSTASGAPKWRSSMAPAMPRTGFGMVHSRSRIRKWTLSRSIAMVQYVPAAEL